MVNEGNISVSIVCLNFFEQRSDYSLFAFKELAKASGSIEQQASNAQATIFLSKEVEHSVQFFTSEFANWIADIAELNHVLTFVNACR